jgi:release factor glutamine methyltransferase
MTIGEALRQAETRLRGAGIEASRREARLMLERVAAIQPSTVLGWPERPLDAAALQAFMAAVDRRAGREPLSRILGRREFWSLEFGLSAATLDPRPDSETLVEAALAQLRDREAPWRLLDLGTGSGCLLLALLAELPRATGLGIDCSEGAVRAAAATARRLGISSRAAFAVGDWAAPLGGVFDLAISNPPYIASGQIAALEPEVRLHDPPVALDGGPDGLAAYRALAGSIGFVLGPRGLAVIELGAGQAGDVAAIFAAAGFETVEIRPDLAGIPRAFVGRQV